MNQRTPLKDFKDIKNYQNNIKREQEEEAIRRGQVQQQRVTKAQAFALDEEDPELDLKTWLNIETSHSRRQYLKLQANEMSCKFVIKSKERATLKLDRNGVAEATHLHLRIGAKVLKNCGWRTGETMAVFQHPQDKTVFGIMPKPHGLKIRPEGEKDRGISYMTFKFPNDTKMLTQPSTIVEYIIHENGYLLFRLPEPKKDS